MIFRDFVLILIFLATTSAQTLVPEEFFFEYRFFANTAGEVNSTDAPLATMLSSLKDHLNDYIVSIEDVNIVIDSIDYFTRASCTEDAFELEYSDCGTYRSNVVMNIDSEYDPVVVKQILTKEIQTYVEDIYATENNNQADSIYDYPKWVQATVYIELVGVSTLMDDDESFLFLKEFEAGFRPKMEEDNYDWINNVILYQEKISSEETFAVEERNFINKIKIMPKATCSGDSCNNQNFYNYLIVNLEQYAEEFLGRLQAISPSGSDFYFNDIVQILVRNEKLEVPNLPVASDTDPTARKAGDDKEIPFWLWVFAAIAVIVVLCVLVYLCILSPSRKATASRKEVAGDGFDHPSNHMNEGEHQSQETPL